MSHVRMFVIILLVSAVATVYGQERQGTETGTAQLSIYKLPPLERAIRCTKYYEGWHGEKKHWPYVGWGHKVLPGERFTNDITKAQGDSILRADMMKLCRLFSRFGRDSLLLSEISDNKIVSLPKIGAGLGKLDWNNEVKPLLESILSDSETVFNVYEDYKIEYEN